MIAPAHDRLFHRRERGSAMLATLCLALVFTICLASYITVTYQALTMSTRNVSLAHAREVAETGLELALYTANYETSWPGWTYSGGVATASFTMTSTGLALTSSNPTPLNLGNGSTATVTVTVNTSVYPETFSSTATVSLLNQIPLTRKLTATASITPTFVNALAATTGAVTFKAAGTVDSYNSGLGPYSAGSAGFAAPVISQSSSTLATVAINNAQVSGFASGYNSANPTSTNWLSYAGSGKVVGAGSGSTYIDSNRVITNPVPYQPQFPEVVLPNQNALALYIVGLPILNLGVPGVLSVYKVNGDVNIALIAQLVVNGPTVIYVYGNFNYNPGVLDLAQIWFNDIPSTNHPSLEIHMVGSGGPSGGNVTIVGSPLFNLPTMVSGATPSPKALVFCGTTDSGGLVNIQSTTPIYGEFYFPNAPVVLANANTIYGSMIGSSITVNGSPAIHYDTSLRTPTSNIYDAAFHAFTAPLSLGNIAESAGP